MSSEKNSETKFERAVNPAPPAGAKRPAPPPRIIVQDGKVIASNKNSSPVKDQS